MSHYAFVTMYCLIASIGPTSLDDVSALIREAKSGMVEHRIAAILKLGKAGEQATPIIPDLIQLFLSKDTPDEVGEAAGQAVIALGELSLPALAGSLKTNPNAANGIMWIISQIGTPSRVTEEALVPFLSQRDIPTQINAAETLIRTRSSDKRIAQALVNGLSKDNTTSLRVRCVELLARYQPNHPAVVPALIELCREYDGSRATEIVASRALRAFWGLGSNDPDALKFLQSFADKTNNTYLKVEAAGALIRSDPSNAFAQRLLIPHVQLISRELYSASPQARFYAADILGRLGKGALPAVDDLEKVAATSDDPNFVATVQRSLNQIKGK